MSRERRTGAVVLWIVVLMVAGGCVPAQQKVQTVQKFEFKDGGQATQIQSGLEVTVTPLSKTNMYDFPELFSFSMGAMPGTMRVPATTSRYGRTGIGWEYILGSPDGASVLTAFKLQIKNNTGNILRMGDARIYLTGVGSQEPIQALSKVEGEGGLKHILTAMEEFYERTRKNPSFLSVEINAEWPVGFLSAVINQNKDAYRLINDLSSEILPGFVGEGLLVFPVPITYDDCTLAMFDVTTKTDAAGNPAEKTTFQFDLHRVDSSIWLDEVSGEWKLGTPLSASN